MKVCLINTSECKGGAAIACNRLMKALQKNGITVRTIVRDKQSQNSDVLSINTSFFQIKINFLRFIWERFVIWVINGFSRTNLFNVSLANTGMDISKLPEIQNADIIHLHWINQGLLSLQDIRKILALGKPVVWTLHDMWPCTAICHHAGECNHFEETCGNCFFLKYPGKHDLSAKVWKRKKFFNSSGMTIVTVSNWLRRKVESSSLMNKLDTLVIPNTIDLTTFYPREREMMRKKWQILTTDKVIVFGAHKINDPIKGLNSLENILAGFKEHERKHLLLILFGGLKGCPEEILGTIPCRYRYLGGIDEPEVLAELYSIADMTVVPSYYETFGQTIIESMACGTPVVTFDNSGQTDIISHQQDGYLAKAGNWDDFRNGMQMLLGETKVSEWRQSAINKVVKNYSEENIALQYINLYEKLLLQKKGS